MRSSARSSRTRIAINGLGRVGRALLRQAVSSGATVIVASHERERAGALADRVVEVVAGQVYEDER